MALIADELDELVDVDPLRLRDEAIALLRLVHQLRDVLLTGGQSGDIVRRAALKVLAEHGLLDREVT